MSKFFTATIGRKSIMSISGLFLVLYIAIHLSVNLLLIFDDSGKLFNIAADFMTTNPFIKIMEPVLAIGFLVHIIWGFLLEYKNWRARPIKYEAKNPGASSSWTSRNMIVIGIIILVFLVIHLGDFFWKIKFSPETIADVSINGREIKNSYILVSGLFKTSMIHNILYIIGGIFLGIHLSHGFWSAFHSIGLSNKHWMRRLQIIGNIYAILVAVGFSMIPLYFMLGLYN